MRHEAMLFERRENGVVRCQLCSHRCFIYPGHKGLCAVRENDDGNLYTLVYGRVISQAVDPIEKKPLFHFLPGSHSYSIATPGCNFRCTFCQNWQISQLPRMADFSQIPEVPPRSIIASAKARGCASISYTYTEPTIFFEYALDCMRLAREQGLKNVFVTNGYMTEDCLDVIAKESDAGQLLNAANVDLKAWSEEFYRAQVGAHLEPVLKSLIKLKAMKVWVEVTTLLIPGLNDDENELREIAKFMKEELGPETPWHVSRFHPAFQLRDIEPTSVSAVLKAREIGLEVGLRYVYAGNILSNGSEDTYCHECGCALLMRSGFGISANKLEGSNCPQCGAPVAGVWQSLY